EPDGVGVGGAGDALFGDDLVGREAMAQRLDEQIVHRAVHIGDQVGCVLFVLDALDLAKTRALQRACFAREGVDEGHAIGHGSSIILFSPVRSRYGLWKGMSKSCNSILDVAREFTLPTYS